jgi:hypothetical protein
MVLSRVVIPVSDKMLFSKWSRTLKQGPIKKITNLTHENITEGLNQDSTYNSNFTTFKGKFNKL